MKIDTQGASVLDKYPISKRSSWGHTHFGGMWHFRSSSETAGSSNTQLMRTSTGSSPVIAEILRLLRESYESVEEKFQRLSNEWKHDTGHMSTVSRIVTHPSYLDIIAIGKPVIPLILKDLEMEPNHWFSALHAIEGEGPKISTQDRGDMRIISAAWLEWGKSKNYIE